MSPLVSAWPVVHLLQAAVQKGSPCGTQIDITFTTGHAEVTCSQCIASDEWKRLHGRMHNCDCRRRRRRRVPRRSGAT